MEPSNCVEAMRWTLVQSWRRTGQAVWEQNPSHLHGGVHRGVETAARWGPTRAGIL